MWCNLLTDPKATLTVIFVGLFGDSFDIHALAQVAALLVSFVMIVAWSIKAYWAHVNAKLVNTSLQLDIEKKKKEQSKE